jgi:hypothetical protein
MISGLAAAPDYAWPLDLPRQLTASFGEYRPGRYHAGVDLRTPGTGYAAHAVADGHVSRILCSPVSYGRAVFIETNDGHTVVYGHLEDYADELRAYVREEQHRLRRYQVELTPDQGRFPVKRGQVLGKTGNTGISGGPHLHFEIRDAKQQPLNPRNLGLDWEDHLRPTITKVLLAPADPESSVNGDPAPIVLTPKPSGDGRYACDPVRVHGRIGVGVDIVDPTPAGDKLGAYRVQLIDGGTEVFRVQNDVLSYDTITNGVVAWYPYLIDKGKFLSLWRWPGNRSASYAHSPTDGWWTAPNQETTLRVVVVDFMGNEATLTIPVRPERAAAPVKAAATASAGHGRIELSCGWNMVIVSAHFTAPEKEAPELRVTGGAEVAEPAFHPVTPETWRASFAPAQSGTLTLRVTHPRCDAFEQAITVFRRDEGARTADFGAMRIRVSEKSPYGALMLWSGIVRTTPETALRALGKPFRLMPELAPIDTPIDVSMAMPAGAEKAERVQIYQLQGDTWVAQDTKREDGRLTVSARNLGTYAVFEDAQPPSVVLAAPEEAEGAHSRRPVLTARISDVGSGIGEIEATCGGQWLLMAYEPKQQTITWERDEDLPPGNQELVVRVTDRAGNRTTKTRMINVPN